MKLQKETKRESASGHGRWYGDACGTAFALEVLGERWSMLVVRELMLGPRRFSDLRASLPGISAKVLTQRLEGLEISGVLTRSVLPPPASVQVYELTAWGYRAEPLMQELGRWAAASPLHDPTLPISAVSTMLSLRTMFDPAKAGGLELAIGFEIGRESFVARLANGRLPIERAPAQQVDCVLRVSDAATLIAFIYGKVAAEELVAARALVIEGEYSAAQAFAELFELPR